MVVVDGDEVRSGSIVVAHPLVIRSTALASQSMYARIVELVREAQAAKAPLQRLADRWAVWFTPLTILACVATYLVTGDAIRVLAVLVVATPCPLILAAPVAFIGGINSAARTGVIIRTGAALERLASIDAVALDKTGTLTVGHPEVQEIRPATDVDPDSLLRLAAALERRSGHILARSVVRFAVARGLEFEDSRDVREDAGLGISGMVGHNKVALGSPAWVRKSFPEAVVSLDSLPPHSPAETIALVMVDGSYAGAIVFADTMRPGLAEFLQDLKAAGVSRTVLLSGDRADRVAHVARELGISEAHGELLPDGKVEAIRGMVAAGHKVAMVGDGVNDAPALSAATVGIALAAHGGGIAAESADCVLLTDDLSLATGAMRTARRTLEIARQSIYIGVGLSAVAMAFAAAGYLSPVTGALLQEAIDVAVILNAIRAATPPTE